LNNGGAVTVDFKEVVEQINQYLAQVTIEQFERDLQRAGIEQCPDIGEEADSEWQPERLIVEYSILEEPYSDLTNGYIAIANGEAA
jgi:hypothetical protein